MKDEYGGVIIDEFAGLKSKMYSIKKIDGKELSTVKGVNIATEFNEFKDVLFIKKVIRHKIKRIHVLMIKDMQQMMELILQLIFIKIVIKKIVMIKKDCDNRKDL